MYYIEFIFHLLDGTLFLFKGKVRREGEIVGQDEGWANHVLLTICGTPRLTTPRRIPNAITEVGDV